MPTCRISPNGIWTELFSQEKKREGKKKRSVNFNRNENSDCFQILFHFKILLGAKYKRNLLLKFWKFHLMLEKLVLLSTILDLFKELRLSPSFSISYRKFGQRHFRLVSSKFYHSTSYKVKRLCHKVKVQWQIKKFSKNKNISKCICSLYPRINGYSKFMIPIQGYWICHLHPSGQSLVTFLSVRKHYLPSLPDFYKLLNPSKSVII